MVIEAEETALSQTIYTMALPLLGLIAPLKCPRVFACHAYTLPSHVVLNPKYFCLESMTMRLGTVQKRHCLTVIGVTTVVATARGLN